jgi:glycosyltransferase involved in cell wall biosynthesis
MSQYPKVSVCMITYGHEKYIRQAIEGILMQQCDFKVELVLANDCSPDATDQIVKAIIDTHPRGSWIKYICNEKNLGMMPNFIFSLKECKGEYIALCEGDDYWTDPFKLQKQVGFLEANPEYVIHSGNAVQLSTNIKESGKPIRSGTIGNTFELADFLSNNNIITCTVIFRNIKFQFPDNFHKVTFGDWFLYVILLNNTGRKVYRSMKLYSVYRVHSGGVMSNLSVLNNYNAHILQITIIHKYLGNNRLELKELNTLNTYLLKKFRLVVKDKLYFEALKTFITNFKYCTFNMPFRKYLSTLKQNILED